MSTFSLPNSQEHCPVHLPSDLTKEQLLNFPAFKNWISNLQHSLSLQKKSDHTFHKSPYKLRKIDVQSCDFFGGERLGFVKLQAEVTNDDGEYLPGAVFLRGGSVGMLLILQPDDVPEGTEEEKYVILTVQPRIAAGSLALTELPAGMLDDSGKFAGKAAAEIEEETGLKVAENELIDMTSLALPSTEEKTGETLHKAMYPSAGGCDEFIPLFLHERRVKRETLDEWTGKLTGLRDHGEKITLKLVALEDLYSEGGRDAKALGAWALYRALREKGKLHTGQVPCSGYIPMLSDSNHQAQVRAHEKEPCMGLFILGKHPAIDDAVVEAQTQAKRERQQQNELLLEIQNSVEPLVLRRPAPILPEYRCSSN